MRLDEQYSALFKDQPEGWALYKNVSMTSMRPGFLGYFDTQGDWRWLLDLTAPPNQFATRSLLPPNEQCWVQTDGTSTKWFPKVSSRGTGVEAQFLAGAGGGAAGIPVEGSAELAFKTSKHAGAICVTEPICIYDLANAHVIFPWMTLNVDTLIRDYGNVIENYGLWVVTKTYTSPCAAVGVLRSQSNCILGQVKLDVQSAATVGLSASSWSGQIAETSAINWSTEQGGDVVVFMSGLCFRRGYPWNKSKIKEVVKPKKLTLKGGSEGDTDTNSEKVLKARGESGISYELPFEAFGVSSQEYGPSLTKQRGG